MKMLTMGLLCLLSLNVFANGEEASLALFEQLHSPEAVRSFATFMEVEDNNIETYGTIRNPQRIVVRDENGQLQTYDTSQLGNEFALRSDKRFSMGMTSRCSPFIGTTVSELRLPVRITQRAISTGEYDENYNSIMTNVRDGVRGRRMLVIPAGANVFGTCQGNSNVLEELSINAARGVEFENIPVSFPTTPTLR